MVRLERVFLTRVVLHFLMMKTQQVNYCVRHREENA